MNQVIHICAPNSSFKGLGNNAHHTTTMLREKGISAEWVQSPAAEIVYHVNQHKPTVAVIMAVWVPPAEVARLAAAFPETTFIIKNHSGPQFLAQEGKRWLEFLECGELSRKFSNVKLAVIRPQDVAAMVAMGMPTVCLPNVYSPQELRDAEARPKKQSTRTHSMHVGLFGACRPLKNVVGMAFAATQAAAELKKRGVSMTLHVNQRTELGGACDIEIATDMCKRAGITLEKRAWLDHVEFKQAAASMDVCLTATYHDTYNYVAADVVTAGTPVIGSPAIPWLPAMYQVNPDNTHEIAEAILSAPSWSCLHQLQALQDFDAHASKTLLSTLAEFGVKPAASTKEPISV